MKRTDALGRTEIPLRLIHVQFLVLFTEHGFTVLLDFLPMTTVGGVPHQKKS